MKQLRLFGLTIVALLVLVQMTSVVIAQNEFAASLEVINSGVEVQRVNTTNFIAVQIEAIVGVGDTIRTDETGEAWITFFADGTDVTLEPDTEYQIIEFQGDDDTFQLTVSVLAGQATHRLSRVVGTGSSYDVETPGMTLAAQGTVFAVRVEDTGRSGLLVFEGLVDAGSDDSIADVPADYGIRSNADGDLSDVVRASTFAQLDSAIDGCFATLTTVDDVSINVRSGPSLDATQLGITSDDDIDTLFGTNAGGNWYRIAFEDGFGWVLSSSLTLDNTCAGLRVFENSFDENAELSVDDSQPETDGESQG